MSRRWTGARCHECGAPLDLALFYYQDREYCDRECAEAHTHQRPIIGQIRGRAPLYEPPAPDQLELDS